MIKSLAVATALACSYLQQIKGRVLDAKDCIEIYKIMDWKEAKVDCINGKATVEKATRLINSCGIYPH